MPHGLKNWKFIDVQRFLHEHGFVFDHITGSHHFYGTVRNGEGFHVCVQFHGPRSIKPKTMKSIVEQSGIDRKEWTGK